MSLVTITAKLQKQFKVVADKRSSFGFFVEYKGKLYETDITLHPVSFPEDSLYSTTVEPFFNDEVGNGFSNVQALTIS